MHYTSVPNILKVLNPLFLDELREQLDKAGDSSQKLLNLRRRIAKIRVFDPACGSGNFLVIAYKELRAIEAEINKRRGESDRHSDIPLTNFRGIEIRHFSTEIARLALVIAEYQCDVLYRGPRLALAEFLPLKAENWITCGNALHIDWLSICPPTGTDVRIYADDLFSTPLEQSEIEFENEGGETYICGNPPYLGFSLQSDQQKSDLLNIFGDYTNKWKVLDYVSGWFLKAAQYGKWTNSATAFVATNSVCQGQHVSTMWPLIYETGNKILFAHTSFKWSNLASHNAGVTVVIVGISKSIKTKYRLFSTTESGEIAQKIVRNINAYLVPVDDIYVESSSQPLNGLPKMDYGSKPADGGNLVLSLNDKVTLEVNSNIKSFIKPYIGSTEYIEGKQRFCLWVDDEKLSDALEVPELAERIKLVQAFRGKSKKIPTKNAAKRGHSFVEVRYGGDSETSIPFIVPIHTSENREFLPVGYLPMGTVVSNAAFAIYDAPIWTLSLIASRIHLVWIGTVCGKLETRYRYSNTLGWNTFPVPTLTEQNKIDLTHCAEDILLAREHYFPATIADMYDPDRMDREFPLVRQAHERNDEVLERIYIGRRFKNDTERLETLFDLYSRMISEQVQSI